MTEQTEKGQDKNEQGGQKFFVNIEGTEHNWSGNSITVEQIRELGNLPADQPVVEGNPDGTERTLAPGEAIALKPGHRFGRAARYKRG